MYVITRQVSPFLVQYCDYSVACVLCDQTLGSLKAGRRHLLSLAHKGRYAEYHAECRRLGTDVDRLITCGRVRSDVPVDEGRLTDDASTEDASNVPRSPAGFTGDADQDHSIILSSNAGLDVGPIPAVGDDAGASIECWGNHPLNAGASGAAVPLATPPVPAEGGGIFDGDSLASIVAAAKTELRAAVDSNDLSAAANMTLPSAHMVASMERATGCQNPDYHSDDNERLPYHDDDIPAGPVRQARNQEHIPPSYSSYSDLYVRLLVPFCWQFAQSIFCSACQCLIGAARSLHAWWSTLTTMRGVVQSFQATLQYLTEVIQDMPERFRGGIEDGVEMARAAAAEDGIEWNEDEVYEALMTELQGLMAAKLGDDAIGDKKPREKTIAWYIERHHEPVAPGVDLTVLQACYFSMQLKHHHNMNETGMDKLCAFLSVGGVWPEDNLMPRCCTTTEPRLRVHYTRAVAVCHVHTVRFIVQVPMAGDWPALCRSQHLVKGVLGIANAEQYTLASAPQLAWLLLQGFRTSFG